MITPGARLDSQVCDTQVIVIRASAALAQLRCGGAPMVPAGDPKDSAADLDSRFADGSALGKRYTHDTGAELLVTRAGAGSLAIDDAPSRSNRPRRCRPAIDPPATFPQASINSTVVVTVASRDRVLSMMAVAYSRGTPATPSRGTTTRYAAFTASMTSITPRLTHLVVLTTSPGATS